MGRERRFTAFKRNSSTYESKREIEVRERLVQTFLIISGFLLTYGGGKGAEDFLFFFTFSILYYAFLTRTNNYFAIDFFAVISAFAFSTLIIRFSTNLFETSPSSPLVAISLVMLIFILRYSIFSPKIITFLQRPQRICENIYRLIWFVGLVLIFFSTLMTSIFFVGYYTYLSIPDFAFKVSIPDYAFEISIPNFISEICLYLGLILIFTYSLISPEFSKMIDEKLRNGKNIIYAKYPTIPDIVLCVAVIIFFIYAVLSNNSPPD